jgi:hypothetical protein
LKEAALVDAFRGEAGSLYRVVVKVGSVPVKSTITISKRPAQSGSS